MRAYLDGMDRAAVNAPALAEPPPTVLAALGPQMTVLGWTTFHPYKVIPEHTPAAQAIIGPENGAAWSKEAGDGVLPAVDELSR